MGFLILTGAFIKWLQGKSRNGNGTAVVAPTAPNGVTNGGIQFYQMERLIGAAERIHGTVERIHDDVRQAAHDAAYYQSANERAEQGRHEDSQELRLRAITTIREWQEREQRGRSA